MSEKTDHNYNIAKVLLGVIAIAIMIFIVVLLFWNFVFQDLKYKQFEQTDKGLQYQIDSQKKDINQIKKNLKKNGDDE